jgi:hypothetical protein
MPSYRARLKHPTRRLIDAGLVLVLSSGVFSACTQVREKIEAWVKSPVLGVTVESKVTASPAPSGSPLVEVTALALSPGEVSTRNSEVLQEIYRVVMLEDPSDRSVFGNWVDTLNQGASFEGVYNGFVRSATYVGLETKTAAAPAEAVTLFLTEWAELEYELSDRAHFELVEGALELRVREVEAPQASVNPSTAEAITIEKQKLIEPQRVAIIGHSVFTLKRLLGEAVLRWVGFKRKSIADFASGYAKWAIRLSTSPVDFGLSARKKNDEGFHYQWAVSQPVDVVQWEMLNRVHRLLNQFYRKPEEKL